MTDSPANRHLEEIIAHRPVVVLSPNDTLTQACQVMWRNKAGCVLVADQRQRLVGIFTGRDAVRALAEFEDAAAARLDEAMTLDPITISPDCHAIEALHAMSDGGFRHPPVVKDETILGVVSRSDFTGVEIDRLDEEEHLKECLWCHSCFGSLD